MIKLNSNTLENLLPVLGGSKQGGTGRPASVAAESPDEDKQESSVNTSNGGGEAGKPAIESDGVGRTWDGKKVGAGSRTAKRATLIEESEEKGLQEALGNDDGHREADDLRLEEYLAREAEKDSNIIDRYVIPWLLTQSTGFSVRNDENGPIYQFLDGPENQFYSLREVPAGYKYHTLLRHKYVVQLAYERGNRVLLEDCSEVGKGIGKDWSGDGNADKWIDQAVQAVIPFVVGSKFDSDVHSLTNRALVCLSDITKPWPGARGMIMDRLAAPSFMDKVVQYHKERRANAVRIVEARLNILGGGILASDGDVSEALRRITAGDSRPSDFGWFGIIFLAVLTFFIPVVGLTLGLTYGILALWRRYNRWVRVFDEAKVRVLVDSFVGGSAKARFASVLSLLPTCSGTLRKQPGLVDGEGGFKVKVKFAPGLEPCKELKPYAPYGSVIKGAPMVVPACCHHDINNAAAIRFLYEREQRTDLVRAVIGHAQEWLLPLFKANSAKWWYVSRSEWLAHLPGKRRNMLCGEPEAVDLWSQNPIDSFVKREAYLGKDPESFKPRMIMGRKLGYQNVVGHYMYSVSKFVGRVFNINTDCFYVSGNTPQEVGDFAHRLFSRKRRVLESDVSNWDGSLHPMWRDFEVWFIENCVPADCPRWAEVKAMWRNTVVNGPKGFQMKTNFCRHSGDMWTSFMNSIINLAIVKFVDPNCIAGVLGDDNFWGTSSDVSVQEIVDLYAKLGMKVEVIERSSIEQLEFCSGRFYSTDVGYVWGVKPFRLLAKLGLNLNRRRNGRQLLYGTALSMLPVANHVPVIGELLRGIVASGSKEEIEADVSEGWVGEWRMRDNQVFDPSSKTYAHFQSLYDFTQSEMVELFNVVDLIAKTGLDAFPLSLEGNLWLKGFAIDCGLTSIERVATQDTNDLRVEAFPWLPLVVSPVLEEVLKHAFPILAVVFGAIERRWENLWVHVACMAMGIFSLPLAISCHALYNYRVWRDSVDYGKNRVSNYADVLRSLSAEGGLFRPMLDCLPSLKTKDNKLLVAWYDGRCTSRKFFTFNNKQKKSGKPKTAGSKAKNKKGKPSLGRSLLSGGLGALGGLLGPAGASVGASLGDWGANILGMGDYTVDKNSLNMGQGVPTMHAGYKSMRITHREFLNDITGSSAFTSAKYVINPGSQQTFPWLSGIADQFQSYKIHGLAFEFVSTSADALNSVNTALGSVIMATQYNVALPDFTSKAQMAQYEFSCTTRPSRSLMHMVECDPKLQVMEHLFTRVGVLPAGADYQFYDWGNFYLATVGMQAAATIGELWVTYDIEFFKPRIDGSGSYPGDFTRISNGPFSIANPLGDLQTNAVGSLGISISSTGSGFGRIFFPPSISAGRYLIEVNWKYAAVGSLSFAGTSASNLSLVATWDLGTASNYSAVGSTRAQFAVMVTVQGYSASGSYFELPLSGLPTTPQNVDILVVALPRNDVAF